LWPNSANFLPTTAQDRPAPAMPICLVFIYLFFNEIKAYM
jgi:hypothetical protein